MYGEANLQVDKKMCKEKFEEVSEYLQG